MENPGRPIALSRSVDLTDKSSIPSVLLLGKLVSGGSPADSASLLPDKLRHIWDPTGTVNFWRVTDGAFLVQFYEEEDLTKAHDGAPWSCGDGDDLFLMQHVKPGMNMVDQIAGFTKAELWVQFHDVPDDHFSVNTVYALAAGIGEPVKCDLNTSRPKFLRARIRVDITRPLQPSVDVELENGERASVSVEYEGVRSLCWSCRILGHRVDHCRRKANKSRRENPAVYAPSKSNIGSRRSTSASSSSSSSILGKSLHVSATTAPVLPALRSGQEGLSPVNGTCFNFFNLKMWRKRVEKNNEPSGTGDHDPQDEKVPFGNQEENQVRKKKSAPEIVQDQDEKQVLEKKSAPEIVQDQDEKQVLEKKSAPEIVQEPSIMDAQVTQRDPIPIMHSHFIVKTHGSRSRKHARIEVMMETDCSPQLIKGGMEWLSKNAECPGLDAAYDGKRGVISIFGLQIDQNTDPVDLIGYLLPKIRQKTRFAETQTKPDSPARLKDMMVRFHDVNCCKDASKESGKNGV
ncbi:hypothetical protein QYE76_035313 [Lolium multiflorum]|uniref:Zinc knuckle CX2CX4HX4C domain-containing protein n=1 Tax=Lolium multiflorum TaxID=4521 RepID=A0AAD8QYS3_LOLMU|nr:hypothetical protein QYE76_035313 [Lolium multiflorum]